MTAYYNEFDPKCAAWLRQLIKNGSITEGVVDERSIEKVRPDDLIGFDRVHFFAGIGTWDYCLNEVGFKSDRQVWTASLPCQGFSIAGKQLGKKDERHLLPHFIELVKACKPYVMFGEQVDQAIKHGWLDDLHDGFGELGYEVASSIIPAAAVNKAHIRSRIYWVAKNDLARKNESTIGKNNNSGNSVRDLQVEEEGDNNSGRDEGAEDNGKRERGEEGGLSDPIDKGSQGRVSGGKDSEREIFDGHAGCDSSDSGVGNSKHNGHLACEVTAGNESSIFSSQEGENSTSEFEGTSSSRTVPSESVEWLYCRDNKYRPIKSGIKPLVRTVEPSSIKMVDRTPGGVVQSLHTIIEANNSAEARATRIKGYGNAIVAPVAEVFIKAFMGVIDDN